MLEWFNPLTLQSVMVGGQEEIWIPSSLVVHSKRDYEKTRVVIESRGIDLNSCKLTF